MTQVHVEVDMGLSAMLGVQDVDGSYRARTVRMDGCPTVIVPVLSTLVHTVHQGDVSAAVAHLLRIDWRQVYLLPGRGGDLITEPCERSGQLSAGRLDAPDPDRRQWAYLFCAAELRVHLGVPQPDGWCWQPWACWAVAELPHVSIGELLAVQRDGYARQWQAQRLQHYIAVKNERYGEDVA